MSNYILDYLAPQGSAALVKEAGFLSKLKNLLPRGRSSKLIESIADPVESVAESVKKLMFGAKNKSLVRKNLERITSSPLESALQGTRKKIDNRDWLLSLYHAPDYAGPYHPKSVRGKEVIDQINSSLSELRPAARKLYSRLKGVYSSASPAYNPDMLYQGGRKGLLAEFSKAPNTASMSEELARAIAKDDAVLAAAKSGVGGSSGFFTPLSKGTNATEVLSKLGLL